MSDLETTESQQIAQDELATLAFLEHCLGVEDIDEVLRLELPAMYTMLVERLPYLNDQAKDQLWDMFTDLPIINTEMRRLYGEGPDDVDREFQLGIPLAILYLWLHLKLLRSLMNCFSLQSVEDIWIPKNYDYGRVLARIVAHHIAPTITDAHRIFVQLGIPEPVKIL